MKIGRMPNVMMTDRSKRYPSAGETRDYYLGSVDIIISAPMVSTLALIAALLCYICYWHVSVLVLDLTTSFHNLFLRGHKHESLEIFILIRT